MLNATNTLTIRIKLYLLIGLSLALMLMLSLQGMYAQNRQSAALGRSLDEARIAMEAIESSDSAALHFKIQVQEWKNLLIRGHDAKDFERYLKAFQTEHTVVEGLLKKCSEAFRKLGIDPQPVTKAREAHEELRGKYLEAARRFDPKDPQSYQLVDKAVRGIDRLPTEQIDKLSQLANDAIAKRFDVARSDAQSLEKLMLGVSLTVLVLALVVSISLAVTLVRGISRQLQSAVAAADSVANGDLTATVASHSKDEIGQLLTKLGVMTASLSKIVAEVRVGSHEIATASQQIAAGNINLSTRTEEQASAIEETASTMEEMTATVRHNNDNTQNASSIMQQNSAVAGKGAEAMQGVVQSMASISAASRRISEIITVIDGIAFQTNILALNAAVEAARAGDQGRGFAVVAAEVRSLSQRSATAAKEIKALIEDAVSRVEAGETHVREASVAMDEILEGVLSASKLLSDIATTTREQTSGIEQVSTTIAQMEHVTQENAAMVEEASAAAQSLSDQAERFLDIIAQFKLDEAALDAELRVRSKRPPAGQDGNGLRGRERLFVSRPALGSFGSGSR